MNPITPLGVINRQDMKHHETREQFFMLCAPHKGMKRPETRKQFFMLCAPHKMFFATKNLIPACMGDMVHT